MGQHLPAFIGSAIVQKRPFDQRQSFGTLTRPG
jgi:hypothetical protein